MVIKLNLDLEDWEAERQQAEDDGHLNVWLSKNENAKPTVGARQPCP